MDKKHILYITYDGLTDFLGQSQVLPYILGLEEQGYRFSILSFEKTDQYTTNQITINALIKNRNVSWYPKKYHKRFSIVATLWDLIIGLSFLIKLHSKDAFQTTHCRSYIPAILGLVSKQLFKTKFIFDMRGFWADERIDGGLWTLKNPVYRTVYNFFKWIERTCLLHADYVVTLTKKSYLEMQSWDYVSEKTKFKIIPCCVDLSIFNPDIIIQETLEEKRKELKIQNRTVVNYLGSIGTWYMIDEMFDYFKLLKDEFPDAVFLFITPESENDVLKIAGKHGVQRDDIRVVKAQRKEVPYYLTLSDYALFFIKPAYSKISSSPTKLAEIMAMGIPVICNSNVGDVEEQVVEGKAGVVIKSFSKKSYIDSLDALTQNKENVFQRGVALQYVNQYFSLENGVTLYSEIYSEVVV